jgi:hypothetical protein
MGLDGLMEASSQVSLLRNLLRGGDFLENKRRLTWSSKCLMESMLDPNSDSDLDPK